ncbi:ABC transporter ATP-binding protein [Blastopirellula marina]|uniref:Nitrate/sulfonate/bicarbonate ABC transporter ATP-binding protein n=1 Tax=Blastopirellula marina TaxID=124 RepID=A0A2S8FSK1_9BACT|nr:ABC transporter ATP-binding protein [Blastopirellula marina]PQO35161.1 nitrate/sulfonate/bicarbonate ABC transporter ATP-binding protein [Blastopirellula marina]PTL43910.1 ABC transporter ATP-binding protein [Blastopirellula marina]
MIQLSAVAKTFADQQVIAPTDLTIDRGQFVSLVGPSGCGKSTLLRLIAGLEEATAGELVIDQQPPAKTQTAFVFQDPTLLPWRTTHDNIRLPLELLGQADAQHLAKIPSAIRLVGLRDEDSRKLPRMLSGGMRMRVSLARALVTDPQVLLLDEPFAALDDILRQQLNEELLAIWKQRGWTGVFITHNVAEAVFLSQRVLVMSARPGRIIADVPIEFDAPRNADLRATAEFAAQCGVVSHHLRKGAA